MTDCNAIPAGAVIPADCRPHRAFTGSQPPQVLDEATLTQLESRGAQVVQTAAETEAERWRDLIRDAGSASPSDATFAYLGGDVPDGSATPAAGSPRMVLVADGFAGPGVDPVTDLYEGLALPVRNSAVVENPVGTFDRQINGGNVSTPWLVPNQGTYPGRHYWPICCQMDPGNSDRLVVGAWLVDAPDVGAPYGVLEDTHLLSCSLAFGGAIAQTFTMGVSGLHILKFWQDATHIYSLWEDFHPDYDPGVADAEVYGQGDYDDIRWHHSRIKLARCTLADFDVIANWRWWDGAGWTVLAADAATEAAPYLSDPQGYPVPGDFDVTQVADGTMRGVGHPLVDDHVTVWAADTIVGPWTPIARVRAPGQGAAVNGGIQIGQFASFVEHIACPAEHTMVRLSCNLLDATGDWTTRNIRRYGPQFVVVPHYP